MKADWNTSSAFSNAEKTDLKPSAVQCRFRVLNATAGAMLGLTSHATGRVHCRGQTKGRAGQE